MQVANNTQAFWTNARRLAAQLDPDSHHKDVEAKQTDPNWKYGFMEASKKPIYLLAVDENHEGGHNMCVCGPWIAAKALVLHTHRQATPEESQAWIKEQAAQRVRIQEEETKRERAAGMAMAEALKSALGVTQESAADAPGPRRVRQ